MCLLNGYLEQQLKRKTAGNAKYQHPKPFIRFRQSPYAGPPSPQVDQAWHELLNDMAIRVPKEELEKGKQSSVALPEGGGYLAWPGVYHELHCVVCRLPEPGRTFGDGDLTRNLARTEAITTVELPRPLSSEPDREVAGGHGGSCG